MNLGLDGEDGRIARDHRAQRGVDGRHGAVHRRLDVVLGLHRLDGCDDLAIGVPLEDLSGGDDAGLTHVLFGTPTSGLDDYKTAMFVGTTGYIDLGTALAAGDLDNDGCDDLIIGIPLFDDGATEDGATLVAYGDRAATDGFDWTREWLYSQVDLPLVGAENYDHFGNVLTILPAPLHRVYLPLALRQW